MVYSEFDPEKRKVLMERFYKLARKYRPGIERSLSDNIAQSSRNFPFYEIAGDVPYEAPARKAADEMLHISLQLRC